MATTTPNYGWDVPTSTDYVKDGATAIETLGDDIDASMFTALAGKKALQHLATGTISGTSITIDNVFSSTYRNYLVEMSVTTTSGSVTLQYINSAGSVVGGSDYYTQRLSGAGGSASAGFIGTTSGHVIATTGAGSVYGTTMEIFAPNVAIDTWSLTTGMGYDGTNYAIRLQGGQYAIATVMRGFVISFPGTTTGKITVYGYTE
jgi:hypothetical protein